MYNPMIPPQTENEETSKIGSVALLRLLIARHPYATVAFFFVYWTALLLAFGRLLAPLAPLFQALHASFLLYEIIAELTLVAIVLFPVLLLKWGSATGFTRGISWFGLVLCIAPVILVAGPSLLALPLVINSAPISITLYALVLSLLVGIAEEGMFRGLLVSVLLPKGIWPAVLISAAIFAFTHLVNLLSDASFGYVLGQMILAFSVGVLFAALRLRTRSLWPGIVLHMLRDLAGLILLGVNPAEMSATPSGQAFIINIVFGTIFIINALILLRASQKEKLEVEYGLARAPQPVMPAYPPYPTYGFPQQPGYPPLPSQPGYPQQYPAPSTYNPPQPPPASGEISYQEYTSPTAYGAQPASKKDTSERIPDEVPDKEA